MITQQDSIKQADLFNDWKHLCHRLEEKAGIIQNDFSLLLEDGQLDKERLIQDTDQFVNNTCVDVQKLLLKTTEINNFLISIQNKL